MNSQQRMLEYQVASDGTVATNGFYRIISEREWSTLPEVRVHKQARYARVIAAIRSGQIVAIPAPDRKRAWEKKRGLMKTAQQEGVHVQTKTVADPMQPGAFLVLARLGESAGG